MLIPPAFVDLIASREGPAGRAWLGRLPGLVGELLTRWDCVADGPARHGGVALVVPVAAPPGPAVIKVSFPHEGNRGEPHALRLLDGRATVRLYEHDQDRWAMLLERADGPGPATALAPEASVELMGDLARRFGAIAAAGLTPVADTAPGWRQQLEAQLSAAGDGSVPTAVMERARRAIDLVAADRTPTVLHGDLHEGNLLGGERERWLSIDHKGWTGTPAYDAFTVALTRFDELTGVSGIRRVMRDRVRRFATTAGVDPELAEEIAYARAVSSLLYERVTDADTFGTGLLEELLDLR